jgi:hypothetical protein
MNPETSTLRASAGPVPARRRGPSAPAPKSSERARSSRSACRSAVIPSGKSFEVRCRPEQRRNTLLSDFDLSISVGQLVRGEGAERMWNSVIIRCGEEKDGTLAVRVFVSNPDWEELLQVACLRSKPCDPASFTTLVANLDLIASEPD